MEKNLPHRPNLDHLRKQAKDLLVAHKQGDPSAIQQFINHLPEAKGFSTDQASTAQFRLADAQSVIARSIGFASWPLLGRHVELLRALEGEWFFTSLELNGEKVAQSATAGASIKIDGDTFEAVAAIESDIGTFNIDVEVTPHTIDIHFTQGVMAGQSCFGIFLFDGEQLTFCLGLVGATRPSEFSTKPGTNHALETLTRVKPVRIGETPPPVDGEAEVWKALELVLDGKALPKAYLAHAHRIVNGNHIVVQVGGQTALDAYFAIDRSVAPWSIDYDLANGGKQAGIVEETAEGHLKVCMANPGNPRPSKFLKTLGHVYSVWKLD